MPTPAGLNENSVSHEIRGWHEPGNNFRPPSVDQDADAGFSLRVNAPIMASSLAAIKSGQSNADALMRAIRGAIDIHEPQCVRHTLLDEVITIPGAAYVLSGWFNMERYSQIAYFADNTGANPTVNRRWEFSSGLNGMGINDENNNADAIAAGTQAYVDAIIPTGATQQSTKRQYIGARSMRLGWSAGGGAGTTVHVIVIGITEG